MYLKPNFNIDVMKDAKRLQDHARQGLKKHLIEIGTRFVNDARAKRIPQIYKNWTADLVNSIGFQLYDSGKLIHEYYPDDVSPLPNQIPVGGANVGKGFSKKIEGEAGNYNGILLVVVAGMFYSVFVEAKGFDVLTGSHYEATKNIISSFKIIPKNGS